MSSERFNRSLLTSHVAISSSSVDLEKIVNDELDSCVSFIPYCAKPYGDYICPVSDKEKLRKNRNCLKLDDKTCNVPCSLGDIVTILKNRGFTKDRIFIIDSDSNLFTWLEKKKSEGYKYFLPGIGCHYGVGYALRYVQKDIGMEGCIVFLQDYDPLDEKHGVCKSIFDYNNMERVDKGKRTKIGQESISIIEKILSGEFDPEKEQS
ncbi:hypothetical protein [Methanolobus bombayensis]|uniref:hypothetical protein n=1 Tax=Methanolobus bombayensis TaxID=38023 RepID=UPI001FD7A363|nr:hypothetical protein [Methanolobus bombayensis]MBP1909049.1 hypothetical protein [Methanolobus bombayensis]